MQLKTLHTFKHCVLLGYGLEGQASESWIKKNLPEKKISIVERIDAPLKKIDPDAVYVISPGISRQRLCHTIPLQQQTSGTEIFMHNLGESQRKKIIGISGSKGKTTTTKFTHELLTNLGFESVIGGNFGVPLLRLWDQLGDLDFIVAELSSYQLEYVQVSPYRSVFLNFFTDHVARHGSLEAYWDAKQNLWAGSEKKSLELFIPTDFVSVDQDFSLDRIKDSAVFPIRSSITKITQCAPLEANFFVDGSIFQSPHFCQNFGCIYDLVKIVCAQFNDSVEENLDILPKKLDAAVARTAKNFVGEPHRIEFFAEYNDIRFYDDSIATNVFAAKAVVEFFGKELGAIVLGGKSESGALEDDWAGLLRDLQQKSPQAYIWLPESATLAGILAAVEAANFSAERIICGANFSELLEAGLPRVQKKSAVVLSPAAKSFDQFENYKARGCVWKKTLNDFFL